MQLAGAEGLAARLALDREDRRETRSAGRAVRAQLSAALWTGGRKLVLRFVEVPLRIAARETDGSPVAEDLPPFFAKPIRGLAHEATVASGRMRARWLVVMSSIAALVACGAAPYGSTQGARIVRYTLTSRLMHRPLKQVLVIPAGGGARRPLVVLLHGRSAGAEQFLGDPMFRELKRLGRQAPVILIPAGGDHSYWHDRADGPWGTYVVREAIPAALERTGADSRRLAIGGVSMGGFGALDIARLHPEFCAIGAHSAAIWPTAGQTASGAFDDAADFTRHDVMAAAAHGNPYGHVPILVDVGEADGFRFDDQRLADDLRAHGADVTFRLQPGGHSGWRGRMDQYLRFYASVLEHCR